MSTTTQTLSAPSAKKKRRARTSIKTKFCKTCKQDILENEKRDMFMSHDTYHKLQVRDYCKEHDLLYNYHKCKPMWCDKCGYLINYEIIIDHSKWEI
jgi:hypothetical protein